MKITIDTNEENIQSLKHSLKMLEALIAAKQGEFSKSTSRNIFDSGDSFTSSEQSAYNHEEYPSSRPIQSTSTDLFSMFNQQPESTTQNESEKDSSNLPEKEDDDWDNLQENVKILEY